MIGRRQHDDEDSLPTTPGPLFERTRFHGSDYDPALDKARLTGQLRRLYDVIRDGTWRTLRELEDATGIGQASVSAQLRNLRKAPHDMTIEKRRRGNARSGLWEYRLRRENGGHA